MGMNGKREERELGQKDMQRKKTKVDLWPDGQTQTDPKTE
jgi:hypothetical protein